MPKIVGYITKCPICGEPEQELRENVRGTLYMYCERGCSLKFSGAKSRQIKANLAAGKSIFEPNFAIFAQKPAIDEVQHIEKQKEKECNINGKSGEFGRSEPVGRPNRQPAASAGVQPTGTGGRGFLAALFADDDDE